MNHRIFERKWHCRVLPAVCLFECQFFYSRSTYSADRVTHRVWVKMAVLYLDWGYLWGVACVILFMQSSCMKGKNRHPFKLNSKRAVGRCFLPHSCVGVSNLKNTIHTIIRESGTCCLKRVLSSGTLFFFSGGGLYFGVVDNTYIKVLLDVFVIPGSEYCI